MHASWQGSFVARIHAHGVLNRTLQWEETLIRVHSPGRTGRAALKIRSIPAEGTSGTAPPWSSFLVSCGARVKTRLVRTIFLLRAAHCFSDLYDNPRNSPPLPSPSANRPPPAPHLPGSQQPTTCQPLVLSAPGMTPLEVPVVRKVGPGGPDAGGEALQVRVWKDECMAIDQGNAAASWLVEFLGQVGESSSRGGGRDGC